MINVVPQIGTEFVDISKRGRPIVSEPRANRFAKEKVQVVYNSLIVIETLCRFPDAHESMSGLVGGFEQILACIRSVLLVQLVNQLMNRVTDVRDQSRSLLWTAFNFSLLVSGSPACSLWKNSLSSSSVASSITS